MDELQALERWSRLYGVAIFVRSGRWTCTITEPNEGTAGWDRAWEDYRVVGEADNDPLLAMQSALIQARAKWPKVVL